MEFLAGLSSILIFAIICMADKLRKYHLEKKLKEYVSWIVLLYTPWSPCSYSHDMPIWMYVHNAQNKLGIQTKYRICSDKEWEFAKEIIQEYQRDLAESYFKDRLAIPKSKYAITEEHYFMYSLEMFLENHLRDSEFLGHEMKTYGGESSYFLTDFSASYYKLYYVVYLFCKNCKPLNESGMRYNDIVLLAWIEEKIQTAKRKEDTYALQKM